MRAGWQPSLMEPRLHMADSGMRGIMLFVEEIYVKTKNERKRVMAS